MQNVRNSKIEEQLDEQEWEESRGSRATTNERATYYAVGVTGARLSGAIPEDE